MKKLSQLLKESNGSVTCPKCGHHFNPSANKPESSGGNVQYDDAIERQIISVWTNIWNANYAISQADFPKFENIRGVESVGIYGADMALIECERNAKYLMPISRNYVNVREYFDTSDGESHRFVRITGLRKLCKVKMQTGNPSIGGGTFKPLVGENGIVDIEV